MSVERGEYRLDKNQPGLEALPGRRIEAVRLLRATHPGMAAKARLLIMLDDGNWFEFMATGEILPLSQHDAMDIYSLMKRGANAYEITDMAVANPDYE